MPCRSTTNVSAGKPDRPDQIHIGKMLVEKILNALIGRAKMPIQQPAKFPEVGQQIMGDVEKPRLRDIARDRRPQGRQLQVDIPNEFFALPDDG